MNIMHITGSAPATMSSREIADLVDARHDSVRRTIDRLAERAVIQLPPLVEVKNHLGQTVSEYVFCGEHGKRDSIVVVAQLCPEFTARLVDRWQELEARQAPDPVAVLNDPAKLRALLLDNVEKVLALEARVESDRPKTSFYDQFVNTDGLYNLQNAGRALGCRPNLFARFLKSKYMFYQGNALVPRVLYIQMGIFEVKSEIVDDKARPRSFITAKGLEYFAARVPAEIKMMGRVA